VADCVRATAPSTPFGPGTIGDLGWQLTNYGADSVVLALSYTTFGEVETQGAEVGLQHYVNERLKLFGNYTWFDFEVAEGIPGLENVLAPNTPEHRASLGATYTADRWNVSLRGRWVDSFRWFNAATNGEVGAFFTADLNGNYAVNKHWSVGLNVANLFDNQHWEAWSADLIARRALLHVTYSW
jgi:outer membrane receptor protein involved in Fe transport